MSRVMTQHQRDAYTYIDGAMTWVETCEGTSFWQNLRDSLYHGSQPPAVPDKAVGNHQRGVRVPSTLVRLAHAMSTMERPEHWGADYHMLVAEYVRAKAAANEHKLSQTDRQQLPAIGVPRTKRRLLLG